MTRWIIFLWILVITQLPSHAATYYLSAPGTGSGGTGTQANPFRNTNTAFGAMDKGDTLILQAGNYDISISPPKSLSGTSWATATVIEGQGSVILDGSSSGVHFIGGYGDLKRLATEVGCPTMSCLNGTSSLGGRVPEYFIIRNIIVDGTAQQGKETTLTRIITGARNIRFEHVTWRNFGSPANAPIDFDGRILSVQQSNWIGSGKDMNYALKTIWSFCTFRPNVSGTENVIYLNGEVFEFLDSTFDGTGSDMSGDRILLNLNPASRGTLFRNTFLAAGANGGSGGNNIWTGNKFLDGSQLHNREFDDSWLIMQNTFYGCSGCIRFTHRNFHNGHLIVGNIFEKSSNQVSDESKFRTTLDFITVRNNLINQDIVNATAAVTNASVMRQTFSPPSMSDFKAAALSNIDEADDFSQWQAGRNRWLSEGGHTSYGAMPVSDSPLPPSAPPAPINLRLEVGNRNLN